MKYKGLVFFMLLLCHSVFPQSKKDQIENLNLQKDSLGRIIQKERLLGDEKVNQLEIKFSNIKINLDQIKKELKQSKKELAEKEEKILKHKLDYVLREDTIRSLRQELNHIKLSEVPSSHQVKIGDQIWMNKNLDVDRFRNGDYIPQAKTAQEWIKAYENEQPAWCYYDNDSSNYYEYDLDVLPLNGEKFGKLYNWYAVNDPRGLAPLGWHVPSDAEWKILRDYLGGGNLAAIKMKSISGWPDNVSIDHETNRIKGQPKNGNGTNESGFSALPSGGRRIDGTFYVNSLSERKYTHAITSSSSWWSSSEFGGGGIFFSICSGCILYDSRITKGYGKSVRIIKD
jgi:uncharacterized protein (TIGR02145 family)